MLRAIGLHHDAARPIATASPPRYLFKQLEGPLGRTEVGQVHALVRLQHAYQGYAAEVVTLGDHLGTHQDIDLAFVHAREQFFQSVALAKGGVPVQPRHAGRGKKRAHHALHPLGAGAQPL